MSSSLSCLILVMSIFSAKSMLESWENRKEKQCCTTHVLHKFIENRHIYPWKWLRRRDQENYTQCNKLQQHFWGYFSEAEGKPLKNPLLEEGTALPQFDMNFPEWSWLPAQCWSMQTWAMTAPEEKGPHTFTEHKPKSY